jgi:hypothetical protein
LSIVRGIEGSKDVDLEVDRGDLARVRVVSDPLTALSEGQARVRIDSFALTSNNISYAVFGDALRYWDFFPGGPADDGDPVTWGRIPVWGFGEVVESRAPDLSVGERLYGYYPMSSELVLTPGRADERGVTDMAPHRSAMAGAYSRYVRCATDPLYRADREDQQMLLYPLFYTSFLIDDFLSSADLGDDRVVVSSASSKTALGVAFLVRQRGGRPVGLTSPGNREFVEGLDVYDRVITYDAVDRLEIDPSVYVDIAGNRDVLHGVHGRLAEALRHSMTVGGTHWDHQTETTATDLPGPEPVFFFAPERIRTRTNDWGHDGLEARVGAAWDRYVDWADTWVDFRHASGAEQVTGFYHELLGGRPDPRAGFICTLAGDAGRDTRSETTAT